MPPGCQNRQNHKQKWTLCTQFIEFKLKNKIYLGKVWDYNQRWSRGHKARGQGQRHKKISRPRPRTDALEAKAKDQGHRRKCSPKIIIKKKVFKNFFSGDLKNKMSSKFFFRRKRSSKQFFQAISSWGNQKKGLCRFSARFLAFSNEILTVQK